MDIKMSKGDIIICFAVLTLKPQCGKTIYFILIKALTAFGCRENGSLQNSKPQGMIIKFWVIVRMCTKACTKNSGRYRFYVIQKNN